MTIVVRQAVRRWGMAFSLAVGVALPVSFAGAQQVGGAYVSARDTAINLQARLSQTLGDAAASDASIRLGRKTATLCFHCHGEAGNSITPNTPNLAGQNPAYLLEQVRQFGIGLRKNEFMEGLIKAMTAEEKVAVALYFSKQQVATKPPGNAQQIAQGRNYYEKICFRCHGHNGRGNEKIARIAGQQTDYLTTTIKRYRDGSAIRMDPLMAANTKTMNDAEVAAVAAFVSQMK